MSRRPYSASVIPHARQRSNEQYSNNMQSDMQNQQMYNQGGYEENNLYDENDPDIKLIKQLEKRGSPEELVPNTISEKNEPEQEGENEEQSQNKINADDLGVHILREDENEQEFAEFDRLAEKNDEATSNTNRQRILRNIKSANPLDRNQNEAYNGRPVTGHGPRFAKPRNLFSAHGRKDDTNPMSIIGKSMPMNARLGPNGMIISPSQPLISANGQNMTKNTKHLRASVRLSRPATASKASARMPIKLRENHSRRSVSSISSSQLVSPRSASQDSEAMFRFKANTDRAHTSQKERRPNTARIPNQFNSVQMQNMQNRPMTANGFFMPKRKNNNIGVYVVNNRMRCNEDRKRPISAAINSAANSRRERASRINPQKTRRIYEKYLKELEKEAKRFVLEENNQANQGSVNTNCNSQQPIQNEEEMDKKEPERKILLQEVKVQRKRVRLRRDFNTEGKNEREIICVKGDNLMSSSQKPESVL